MAPRWGPVFGLLAGEGILMGSAHSRAFAILGLLRRSARPLGLSSIAKEQGLATSSVHAILTDLLTIGAVTIDSDKRYQLGPRLYYIGSAYAVNSPVYRGTWGELVDLAQELDVSAAIAVPWEDHHLVIAVHSHTGRGPALPPGTRFPLEGGSYGKVYYAWSGEPLPASPGPTVTDVDRFLADVDLARERGYATDDEEFVTGVAAVASAVTSASGYEGLVALWCSPAAILRDKVGFDDAGVRLADLASRASLVLGDLSRQTAWPGAV